MDINKQVQLVFLALVVIGFWQSFTLSIYIALSIWAIHIFMRYNGLLPKKNLQGQHVFITGGAMGIGKELGKQLLQLQCKISLADINLDEAEKTKKEFQKLGFKNVEVFKCDVTNQDNVKEVIQNSVKILGEIDILVNNAGISEFGLISEKDLTRSLRCYDINLVSQLYTVKQVINSMIERNKGHIVTMGSVASFMRVIKASDYHVTKKGALAFHEGLLQEFKFLEKNIAATCICPWFISTNMTQKLGIEEKVMMDCEKAVKRMVLAIQQEEDVVVVPFLANILVFLHQLLPYSVYYALFGKLLDTKEKEKYLLEKQQQQQKQKQN